MTMQSVTVQLPTVLATWLKREARKRHLSQAQIVREVIFQKREAPCGRTAWCARWGEWNRA